jgi:hypothetical protein
MSGLLLTAALVTQGGCRGRDQMAMQPSPDDRFSLTPSFHEGSLIRLTVQDRRTGRVIDDVKPVIPTR